jgi:ribosomal protein S12 methylthiotransferase accessory factor
VQLERRPRTTVAQAFEIARRLVGRCAPVRTVLRRRRRPDQVDLFIHTALANPAFFLDGTATAPPTVGCGAAVSPEISIVAAVGEVIERVFGSAIMMRETHHTTARELGDTALDPQSLAPFSEAQRAEPGFPFARFRADEPIAWVRAFALDRGEERWVPAEAVYLGAHCRSVHLVSSSSGLAAAATREEALVAGIYELIERDAFMIAWAARRTPPELDLETCPFAEIRGLLERARAGRVELRAFDLTTDVDVPTVLGVAAGSAGQTPSLAVGAASRLSSRAALAKALLEALHTWNWTFELLGARGELAGEVAEPTLRIGDFADLVYLYAHPWRRSALDFLLVRRELSPVRAEEPSPPTAAEEIESLIARLRGASCRVLAADLSPDPSWGVGLHVVRALSPDLVPLSLVGHRFYRGCERYRSVPERLGDPRPPADERALNAEPHPFP